MSFSEAGFQSQVISIIRRVARLAVDEFRPTGKKAQALLDVVDVAHDAVGFILHHAMNTNETVVIRTLRKPFEIDIDMVVVPCSLDGWRPKTIPGKLSKAYSRTADAFREACDNGKLSSGSVHVAILERRGVPDSYVVHVPVVEKHGDAQDEKMTLTGFAELAEIMDRFKIVKMVGIGGFEHVNVISRVAGYFGPRVVWIGG